MCELIVEDLIQHLLCDIICIHTIYEKRKQLKLVKDCFHCITKRSSKSNRNVAFPMTSKLG